MCKYRLTEGTVVVSNFTTSKINQHKLMLTQLIPKRKIQVCLRNNISKLNCISEYDITTDCVRITYDKHTYRDYA